MGSATRETGQLIRLPEFRAEDFKDPVLMARKMAELRRQVEQLNVTLNTVSDVLVQGLNDKDLLTYDEASQRWINRTLAQAATAGDGIDITDSTVSLDIDELTAEADVDPTADYVALYDASAAALRKALIHSLLKPRGALVVLTADEATSSGSGNIIPWDAAVQDTDSCWDSGDPTKLTTPSWATWVRVSGAGVWNGSSSVGDRDIFVSKNGSTSFDGFAQDRNQSPQTSSNVPQYFCTPWLQVTAGDYFEFTARQSSGGGITFLANSNTWFHLEAR